MVLVIHSWLNGEVYDKEWVDGIKDAYWIWRGINGDSSLESISKSFLFENVGAAVSKLLFIFINSLIYNLNLSQFNILIMSYKSTIVNIKYVKN